MREHIITSAAFFQSALYANSRDMMPELAEPLLLLSTGHLFGLYNPNQVTDALSVSKNRLYRDLQDMSLYQWKSLLVGITSTIAIEAICHPDGDSIDKDGMYHQRNTPRNGAKFAIAFYTDTIP